MAKQKKNSREKKNGRISIKYPEISSGFMELHDEQLILETAPTKRANELSKLHSKLFLVSFFAGSGLLDLGFESAGFVPIFVDEYNPEFLGAYHHARRSMGIPEPIFGSSTDSVDLFLTDNKRRLKEIVDVARSKGLLGFIGGPPCPDFSIGGKNRGKHGDNGKLTKTYFDLVVQNKPDWFLFENVKGLWSTRRHREFYEENIKAAMDAGYAITDTLINAIEYGVPQDRDRIIAVGFSKHLCEKLGFVPGGKIINGQFPWSAKKAFERGEVFSLPWPQQNPFGNSTLKPAQLNNERNSAIWQN